MVLHLARPRFDAMRPRSARTLDFKVLVSRMWGPMINFRLNCKAGHSIQVLFPAVPLLKTTLIVQRTVGDLVESPTLPNKKAKQVVTFPIRTGHGVRPYVCEP